MEDKDMKSLKAKEASKESSTQADAVEAVEILAEEALAGRVEAESDQEEEFHRERQIIVAVPVGLADEEILDEGKQLIKN